MSHSSPSLESIAANFGVFWRIFSGLTFPTPLKALVVSHLVCMETHKCCAVALCVVFCKLSDIYQSLLISCASVEQYDHFFQCQGNRMLAKNMEKYVR